MTIKVFFLFLFCIQVFYLNVACQTTNDEVEDETTVQNLPANLCEGKHCHFFFNNKQLIIASSTEPSNCEGRESFMDIDSKSKKYYVFMLGIKIKILCLNK